MALNKKRLVTLGVSLLAVSVLMAEGADSGL
jgi:hypothetical protein